MGSREKIIASGASVGAGALGLWGAMSYSKWRVQKHLHNDLHHQVNNACGVSLNDQQWTRLLGTEDWLKYKSGLPSLPGVERFWKMSGSLLFSMGGSTLASVLMRWGLSDVVDLEGYKGFLTFGAASLVIGGFTLKYFNDISKGFVAIDALGASAPLCQTARAIYNEGNRASVTGLVEYEQIPDRSHVAQATMPPRQATVRDRRTPLHYYTNRRVTAFAIRTFARPVFMSPSPVY